MTDHERVAASFAAELGSAAIPGRVRDHVGLVVADTVGAIVGGSTDEATAALAARVAADSPGSATILGTGREAAPGETALVNGTAGTVLELDEGHKYAAGHPAIHVLPALLAEAELGEATVDEFLAAFVAGYEVVTRVAEACYPLAEGYHPHGVWGGVGAATAIARLRGYDVETTLTAMRIAANDAQHTRMAAATEGATVRNTYAGMSNLTGRLAADRAAAGFTGLAGGVGHHLDSATKDGFDRDRLDEALGDRWEVTRGYFKRHAACRYTHPTLDAVEAIQRRASFDPDEVASVRVETYPTAAGLTPTHPGNSLEAKFSVPFAVATRLVHGRSDKAAFERSAVTDATVALAERVEVTAPDEFAARLPDARSARVTIGLSDGRELTETVDHARGGEERPWSEGELEAKFRGLAAPVLGAESADELWPAARDLSVPPAELCEIAAG